MHSVSCAVLLAEEGCEGSRGSWLAYYGAGSGVAGYGGWPLVSRGL